MHYSIYIPNVSGCNPSHLATVGLGELLRDDDASPQFAEVIDKGPDGNHGLYLSWPGSVPVYRPGELNWRPAKAHKKENLAAGRFWWGTMPGQPVVPDDLIRQKTLRGKPIKIKDQYWLIPNLLLLPHEFDLDDDGEEIRKPTSGYASIAKRCAWCYDSVKAHLTSGTPLPEAELRQYAIEMLSLNYRLFRELSYSLGLFNDENWLGIACQTVDFDALVALEEEVKKK